MPVIPEHVRAHLSAYLDAYPGDHRALAPLRELLEDGFKVTSRKEFSGHVTAGAILLNPQGKVLMVEHVALGMWLLPGGHLELKDATLIDAARRELMEEAGLAEGDVLPLGPPLALHIDVHTVPANDAREEPAHQHFDFRYTFRTPGAEIVLQEAEVSGWAWRDPADLPGPVLRDRVLALTTAMAS